MKLGKIIAGFGGKEERRGPDSLLTDGLLVVDCRGCGYTPLPGTKECLGCMVRTMASAGSADRIVLRTGKDTEVSGRAGRAVQEAASIMRWSIPDPPPRGRCRMCPASRRTVMTAAWDAFPDGFSGARALLGSAPPDRDECRACVATTSRLLDQTEDGLERIRSDLREGRA